MISILLKKDFKPGIDKRADVTATIVDEDLKQVSLRITERLYINTSEMLSNQKSFVLNIKNNPEKIGQKQKVTDVNIPIKDADGNDTGNFNIYRTIEKDDKGNIIYEPYIISSATTDYDEYTAKDISERQLKKEQVVTAYYESLKK